MKTDCLKYMTKHNCDVREIHKTVRDKNRLFYLN